MKKRVYTEEFRREAVRLLRTSGKSARQVADELGMPQSVLSRWKCTADNAQKTPAETLSMEEEVRQLRRENERLRMEREVLKKRRPSSPRSRREVSVYHSGEGLVSGDPVVSAVAGIA